MTLRKKIQNKAWKEIQQIQNAPNFMAVEQSISDAIQKTFGLWDWGMKKIIARENGTLEKFEKDHLQRQIAFKTYGEVVRNMLIAYIPEGFRNCLMYKKYITR